MNRFNNDYNQIACDEILNALEAYKSKNHPGYSCDEVCEEAVKLIKKAIGRDDVDIHFLVGGTQTNTIVIKSALRPYESVLAINTGHINVHETGAIEATGHKVEIIGAVNGKVDKNELEKALKNYETSNVKEHITKPRMLYISFPTEIGTIYTKKELTEIYNICKAHNIYLFIDGARLAYGINAKTNDLTLNDITNLCDVYYIGGTKCGAMFGEAVVIVKDELKPEFRHYIKQNGGLLAKGFLLGLQYKVLFTDNLYLKLNAKAIDYAMQIKDAFSKKGIKLTVDSPTNQQFVLLTDEQVKKLSKNNIFEFESKKTIDGVEYNEVRFCTSWSTTKESVDSLIKDIGNLL